MRTHSTFLLAGSLLAVTACTGRLDETPMRPLAERATPDRVPLRALTPAELDHALGDLVGDESHAVLRLQPSRLRGGIETMPSDDFSWSGARSDLLVDTMYVVATQAVQRSGSMRGCAEGGEASCVRSELGALATRAWRRTPTSDELDRLEAVASSVAMDFDRREGLVRATQAILLHPELLYLTSVGTREGVLEDAELAARLSFFLWATVPDDALMSAAARGELASPEGIERQARRMLRDPRAGRAMSRFVTGWIGGYDLGALPRTDAQWGGELVTDMIGETEHFVMGWFQGEERALAELFDADHTYVTPRLATLYGLSIPEGETSTDGFVRIATRGTTRHGLLTQGSFLASHAVSGGSSPTLRGRWFLERVMCQSIDGPPASALADAPAFTADMTTREWHEAIFATPGCNTCHARLEPPGFALEGFDQIGRARLEDRGERVITTTTIVSGTDLDGDYEDEADLSEAVATSPVARDCFTRAWVQSAVGRPVSSADRRLLHDVSAALERDVHEAVIALVTSETFRLSRTTTTDTGADR
ncbi:MAG: DUF1592 domain-containing protein [Deltaproteobacteria bacterium]|nr:DUF1592 domain-containing protein [Deltaproteobacteria bacterium]